ncbi:fimbrial protein [Acinetobacter larvae]|nr:fimbrial protein [Acinetobacter larvae]
MNHLQKIINTVQKLSPQQYLIPTKFLLLGGFFSAATVCLQQHSFANCATLPAQHIAKQMTLDLGPLQINPNLPIGATIAEKDILITEPIEWSACEGLAEITAKITHAQPSAYDANIYRSNIEGVGIALSLMSAEKTYHLADPNIRFAATALQHATLRVRLVKTAAQTGTGYLAAGSYLSFYAPNQAGRQQAILNVNLMAQHNSIQNASCDIDEQHRVLSIDLAPAYLRARDTVGTILAEKTFQIKLNCVQNSQSTQAVHLKFYYQADQQAGAQGVIANKKGRAYAQGVGIQLQRADTQQPILSGEKIAMTIKPQPYAQPELAIDARYYQTSAQVRAGLLYAIATFQIDYP